MSRETLMIYNKIVLNKRLLSTLLVMFISLLVKRNNFISVTEPYIFGFIVMYIFLTGKHICYRE